MSRLSNQSSLIRPAPASANETYSIPTTVLSEPDEGQALLAAILRTPHDEFPRRAYANWLAANGNHERAELIGLQSHAITCSHGRLPEEAACEQGGCSREEELLELLSSGRGDEWAGGLRLQEAAKFVPVVHHANDSHCPGTLGLFWNRGFVEKIRCPAAVFADVAEILFSLHPVVRVGLDDAADCLWTDRKGDGSRTMYLWLGSRRVWLGDPGIAGSRWGDGSSAFAAWLAGCVSRACVVRGRRLAGLPV